ncbi:MAG: glycosyltransferase family 4 protein [Halioglobus sp.]
MRVALLLYKYFPYGGMQRDFARFAAELQSRGHECRVYFITWQGASLPGIDARKVPVRALSNHRRNSRFYEWVQRDLAQDPVDGVIGFNKMPGLDVYYAADSCFLDKAYRERGWAYRRGGRFRHFAAYEAAVFGPNADTDILLISATEKAKFDHYYHTSPARLHLLPPGVSLERRRGPDAPARRDTLRQQLGVKGKDHVLLFVGSGFIKKGLDRVIIGLAHMIDERVDQSIQLWVVGQDRERQFKRLARKHGIANQVRFLGGRDDVPDLLLAADALVHPALDEAAGIVLLEALVAGLPVVTTDICGYAYHIRNAGAGQVIPSPFDQAVLNNAMLRTLDGYYRNQCQSRALEYAQREDLYSMHSVGAALIEQLLEARGATGGR